MTERHFAPVSKPTPTGTHRVSFAVAVRYRIERELGVGGMATVYLARDLKQDRDVALKILWPEVAEAIGADLFVREMRLVAELQHPNILPVWDHGTAYASLFYAMPYVQGETLRARLARDRQLDVAEAIRILTAVSAALQYAHERGIPHRDVKPESIVLSDNNVLVADWGLALAVSQAGSSRMRELGMSLGMTHYLSPEQATGEHEVTGRSDIFALGCVAYEMLLGVPPFTGATPHAIAAQVITEHPTAPSLLRPSVPPHVDAAIRTAIAKLPSDRFANANDFAKALANPGYVAMVTPAVVATVRATAGAGMPAVTLDEPAAAKAPSRPSPRPSVGLTTASIARASAAVLARASEALLARAEGRKSDPAAAKADATRRSDPHVISPMPTVEVPTVEVPTVAAPPTPPALVAPPSLAPPTIAPPPPAPPIAAPLAPIDAEEPPLLRVTARTMRPPRPVTPARGATAPLGAPPVTPPEPPKRPTPRASTPLDGLPLISIDDDEPNAPAVPVPGPTATASPVPVEAASPEPVATAATPAAAEPTTPPAPASEPIPDALRSPIPGLRAASVTPMELPLTAGATPTRVTAYGNIYTLEMPGARQRPRWKATAFVAAAAVVLVVGTAAVSLLKREAAPSERLVPLPLAFPDTLFVTQAELSNDGARLAFATESENVYTRRLDETGAHVLRRHAIDPFWAPDGNSIGFTSTDGERRQVFVMLASGGTPRALADSAFHGAWGDDQFVYFVNASGGLSRVAASGGNAQALLATNDSIGDIRRIVVLPGSQTLVFSHYRGSGDVGALSAMDIASRKRTLLVRDADRLGLAEPRTLLFARAGALMAAALTEDGSALAGRPVVVHLANSNGFTFFAQRAGTLVYQAAPVNARGVPVLRPRRGAERPLRGIPDSVQLSYPYVSPDGSVIAFTGTKFGSSDRDVWVYKMPSGPLTQIAGEARERAGPFTKDGTKLMFSSDQSGRDALYLRRWDGTGPVESALETTGGDAKIASWMPDGRHFVFGLWRSRAEGGDLGMGLIGSRDSTHMIVETPYHEWSPAVSPDGKWLAYRSNESGSVLVYVKSLESGKRTQVGRVSGYSPIWAQGGRELFFENDGGDTLYVARLNPAAGMQVEGTRPVFPILPGHGYAVMPGDSVFVTFAAAGKDEPVTPPMVVLNFGRAVERRLRDAKR